MDFELFSEGSTFTDDTVLTVAVADCLLNRKNYAETFKEYGRNYPDAGYGSRFYKWIFPITNSRTTALETASHARQPGGLAFNNLEETLAEAKRSAEVTHNHPEGIKGAQAVACAIFRPAKVKTKRLSKAL